MGKTVLVVDDDALSVKLFSDLLRERGHRILKAGNGKDVLALARENRPDLIHLDIQLPEFSGIDVLKSLKTDPGLKDIPVIAVTAFAMEGDEQRFRDAGFDGYIAKPVSVRKYMDAIAGFLDGGGD